MRDMYEMNRINNTKPIVKSSGFQYYCDVESWNISFISCMHSKMMPTENNLRRVKVVIYIQTKWTKLFG